MDIQVWSDVVCPWCYLGRHRLEEALAEHPGDVTVTYRAFQLDASPVPTPLPIKQVMAAKFGNADQMLAHVTSIAAAEGITIDYDRAIAANTFDSHRLIAWAATQGRQADMVEALQRAHFAEGVDVGSRPALAAVAGAIGLDQAAAAAYLDTDAGTSAVDTDLAEARALNIASVPFFVVDGKYAIQGAQDSATILTALEEIARREAVDAGR